MRNTRDTFLRFLADNLTGVTVNAVRRDTSRPDGDKLVTNAVNVKFLNENFDVHVPELIAVIDVIHEDELTAEDMVRQVWEVLSARFFTEKYSYSNPSSPVRVAGNVCWDRDAIKFRPINSPFYAHYTCRLPLYHQI
jgi:hypothetical protein